MFIVPTPAWTDKERLQVVNAIAQNLLNVALKDNTLAFAKTALDAAATICLLTTKSASFLEENRGKILAEL